jgi:hypothetical protein
MSKAYVKTINPNGNDGVHSVSPHWVLTFVRWENRHLNISQEGLNNEQIFNFLASRPPMVVENDCASVSVSYSKENHTPSMQALLYPGDVNYLTAVAPGDFVFVNMLNFPEDARRVAKKASKSEPINGVEDGFKGLFKIQSVRRVLTIDPAVGAKRVMFQISGFGFTEFNNTLYFNPFLLTPSQLKNDILFVSRISEIWEQYVGDKGIINVQDILRILIDSSIGIGFNKKLTVLKENLKITQNTHFYIPKEVASLLDVPEAKAAKDIYNYLFGIQTYSNTNDEYATLKEGMNPVIKSVEGRYYLTDKKCQGWSFLKAEYWNQVAVWSILNEYTNSPINELFVTLRVSPEGRVMPTVVFRQMPFSSESYQGVSTKFLNLPRWRISPDLLLDINIGRDEAARINFVQVFGTLPNVSNNTNQGLIANQINGENYQLDILDVRRSGLKPYIISSNFDNNISTKQAVLAPTWAKLLGDFLIGGHLKLNGSIECHGIVDPISVGDNIELDGIVYHIEGISHRCSLTVDGKKTFTTSIQMSHGVDIRSEEGKKIFGQMDNVDMQTEQKEDFDKRDKNLPGFSDDQYILGREENPSINSTKNKSFSSYVNRPSPPVKKDKTERKNGRNKK